MTSSCTYIFVLSFYQNISKFLTTKVSYKISALLTNGEVNVVDLQFW